MLRSSFGRLEKVQAAAWKLEDELRERGVTAVYVFGSVSRGDDGPDSDVDIAIEVSPAHDGFDAWDLGWVWASFQELLGGRVDVLELPGISSALRQQITPDLRRLL